MRNVSSLWLLAIGLYIPRTRSRALPLHLDTMGIIADALRRDLDALRARHEQRGRELEQLLTSTRQLIEKTEKMLAEDSEE